MIHSDVIRSERGDIAALLRSEAAREAIRRGCLVSIHDNVVQQNAARRILHGLGQKLRSRHAREARSRGLTTVTPRLQPK